MIFLLKQEFEMRASLYWGWKPSFLGLTKCCFGFIATLWCVYATVVGRWLEYNWSIYCTLCIIFPVKTLSIPVFVNPFQAVTLWEKLMLNFSTAESEFTLFLLSPTLYHFPSLYAFKLWFLWSLEPAVSCSNSPFPLFSFCLPFSNHLFIPSGQIQKVITIMNSLLSGRTALYYKILYLHCGVL